MEHVGAMTEQIGSISQVLLSGAGGENDHNNLKKDDVVQIVQQELRNSMRPTNQNARKNDGHDTCKTGWEYCLRRKFPKTITSWLKRLPLSL